MTIAPMATETGVLLREPRLLVRDFAGLSLALFEEGRLEAALSAALAPRAAGAIWVRHRFAPRGLSIVCVASGVRVALHTWPERFMLSLDVYGTDPELEQVLAACLEALLPRDL